MADPSTAFMVKCGACQHGWKAATLPMPLGRIAAVLKGLHCPECGADSKQIYVGGNNDRPNTSK